MVRNCASGLHYNADQQKCMQPEDAHCDRDKDECPLFNDPTDLVYHQDDVECGKYFLCYDNKMHEYTCADGLHWDVENERCAYPEDAECSVSFCLLDQEKTVSQSFLSFRTTRLTVL